MFRSERYLHPWKLTGPTPPLSIRTERLLLRCWEAADAPSFAHALRVNREHIGAWVPPVRDEPSDLAQIVERLERFRVEFRTGRGFVYAILSATTADLLGEIALMPRLGAGVLEIGYWIHLDHVGRGFATEATRALTHAGLALPEVNRIEIHCDPANAPSAAVPRRLGYRLTSPTPLDASAQGAHAGQDLLVFALEGLDELGP